MSTYAVKTPEKAEAGEIIAGHAPAERRASVSSSLDAMLDTEFLQKNLAQTKSLKQKLWDLMDDAGSSRAANTISLLIMVLIAVSCVAFVVETIPEIYASESAKAVLSTIEAVCSILFTIEYLLRFFSAPDKIAFLKGVLNFVDLIAVAPWYIEKLLPSGEGGGTAFVRIIRLVRVFRVLKVSRYLTWVRLFASALGKSSQPLALLLFIIVIDMIFFSRCAPPRPPRNMLVGTHHTHHSMIFFPEFYVTHIHVFFPFIFYFNSVLCLLPKKVFGVTSTVCGFLSMTWAPPRHSRVYQTP